MRDTEGYTGMQRDTEEGHRGLQRDTEEGYIGQAKQAKPSKPKPTPFLVRVTLEII